jgi:predicted  nucleic acid-binding Zn-ribbon protein
METKQDELPKGSVSDSRVLTYLNLKPAQNPYANTDEEAEMVQLWDAKFVVAEAEFQKSRVNTKNLTVWRNAYMGIFNQLDEFGEATDAKMKAMRKVAYELVEQKINPRIPAPKMTPRYHSDLLPVKATESLIKQEMDRMLSEETQDESERSCLIDSTTWLKVTWDPFDNTHERSGMPIVENCPIDTVIPQAGVTNYKKLEYIFEKRTMTLAQIVDLYNREIVSIGGTDMVDVIEVYYLNQDRYVGRFVYTKDNHIVLCNDVEWGMRRRRECMDCHTVVPDKDVCPICGGKNLKYVGVKQQTLESDLEYITNPYRSGTSSDRSADAMTKDDAQTIPAGTVIPFYLIRQLPFVPKRANKIPLSMYGISEVQLAMESQDSINKFLNKAEHKSEMSKAYVTKLKDTRIEEGKEITYVNVESAQEAAAIQVKQVMADISEEITMAEMLYQNAKSTTGVTDTDQGKNDPSARSGKAKQLQMMASQSRQAAPLTQRNIAYAGVYELIFKYLLAFCDEERSFISLLPNGTVKEEVWSKYMFLEKDKHGEYYYRDDFAWSVDQATEITQDRASMWQMIDNDFVNGTMGSTIDPVRALRMYWNMKKQYGYPTADFALAFLDEAVKHLPTQIEQALVNNPEAVQLAMSYIQDAQNGSGAVGSGGARDGAGKPASTEAKGQQQGAANNEVNAAKGTQTNKVGTSTGGVQGGTGNDKN